jgi:hypothetical protein
MEERGVRRAIKTVDDEEYTGVDAGMHAAQAARNEAKGSSVRGQERDGIWPGSGTDPRGEAADTERVGEVATPRLRQGAIASP